MYHYEILNMKKMANTLIQSLLYSLQLTIYILPYILIKLYQIHKSHLLLSRYPVSDFDWQSA